jgi:hypothetical protein
MSDWEVVKNYDAVTNVVRDLKKAVKFNELDAIGKCLLELELGIMQSCLIVLRMQVKRMGK